MINVPGKLYIFDDIYQYKESCHMSKVTQYNVGVRDPEVGADPGFVEGGGGAAATASAAGTKIFGGSRLKTLFGISKGGGARVPWIGKNGN